MKGCSFTAQRQRAELAAPGRSPFDILASAYDAWFEEKGKLVFAIELEAFRRQLSSLPRPWLEVGVGSGRFAQALGIDAGVDPSTKLLKMARERGIVTFLSKGERMPFHEQVFGTAFFVATLCFVDSPVAVLREAHRILNPQGRIVLGLVLRESPWGQFYLSKKEEGHRFYKHATFYSYPEVKEFLEHTDFAVEETVSTLFQKPGEVGELEVPRAGISSKAGFTVVTAGKVPKRGQETN